MTHSEISGETIEGWGHDLGFTYLIFLKIEHYRRVELWCQQWWLIKWIESFTNDVDKTTPHSQIASPPVLGLAQLQICNFSVVCCGSDNNSGVRGREMGAHISKVKNRLLYAFNWVPDLHGKYLSYKHFNMI